MGCKNVTPLLITIHKKAEVEDCIRKTVVPRDKSVRYLLRAHEGFLRLKYRLRDPIGKPRAEQITFISIVLYT